GGDNLGDPKMVRILAENALNSAEWLKDEVKVDFLDDQLFQFGGHSYKRALIPVGHTGQEVISKLKKKAESLKVDILVDTKADELIQEDKGKVTRVKANYKEEQPVEFHAKDAVVLTTGGFGSSVEMRKEYNPE